MELLAISEYVMGTWSVKSIYQYICYTLIPTFQSNSNKHNVACKQLKIVDSCLLFPCFEEAIYKWPFLAGKKQAAFLSCLGICAAQIYQGHVQLFSLLAFSNAWEWPYRKQTRPVLLVLAGIEFSLAHAMENTPLEWARVLLTYAPAYFFEAFLAKHLAKCHKNKLWKYAFPLFLHIVKNSLGMLRLFWR